MEGPSNGEDNEMVTNHITLMILFFGLIGGSFLTPSAADAYQRISMGAAKEKCFRRAKRFASEGVGPGGRERSEYEVRSMYKRCIYGYTGKNVRQVPTFRRF